MTDDRQIALFEKFKQSVTSSQKHVFAPTEILSLMTGLRIGEILALRWGRIDLLRGTLHVAETCYKGHVGSSKTRASRREVPLAAAVVRELKNLYSRSAEHSQDTLVLQESCSATNRLAYSPSHARHSTAFARNSFEGCTGSAWTFTYGDNFGDLYTRQRECTKRRCELARRAIVPKCSQVGELRKYRGNRRSVSSVS